MNKTVEIILGKDGSVRVEAFNFLGSSCTDATCFLDKIFPKKKIEFKDSYTEMELETNRTLVDGLPSGHCG